jgi:hypothetical protein
MRSRLLLRVLETLGAAIILALGLWMWLHVILWDAARGANIIDRASLLVFLMWVAPPIVLMAGAYLQSIRGKRWAVVLVLIGGFAALPFVVVNAFFVFGYTADTWGLRAVYVDLVTIAATMVVSMLNTALSETTSRTIAQSL